MNEIQYLKNEIEQLKKEIKALKASSTIPFEIDKAFEGRGFIKALNRAEFDPLDYDSTNKVISFTGEPDQFVLEFPSAWIRIPDGTVPYPHTLHLPAYALVNLG